MMARRPLYAFVLALILWAPSAKGFLHDNLDLTTTAVRFLIALAASWIGITILALVVAGYGKTAAPAEAPADDSRRRRKTDGSGPEDDTLSE